MTFSLVPCDRNGTSSQLIPDMPEALVANCQATADLYRCVRFIPPWIGYVAVVDNRGVGGGAFIDHPRDGHEENAYFTLENEQHKGYESQTAASLVAMARTHSAEIGLKVFTLKKENPSTQIFRSLGVSIIGV